MVARKPDLISESIPLSAENGLDGSMNIEVRHSVRALDTMQCLGKRRAALIATVGGATSTSSMNQGYTY